MFIQVSVPSLCGKKTGTTDLNWHDCTCVDVCAPVIALSFSWPASCAFAEVRRSWLGHQFYTEQVGCRFALTNVSSDVCFPLFRSTPLSYPLFFISLSLPFFIVVLLLDLSHSLVVLSFVCVAASRSFLPPCPSMLLKKQHGADSLVCVCVCFLLVQLTGRNLRTKCGMFQGGFSWECQSDGSVWHLLVQWLICDNGVHAR